MQASFAAFIFPAREGASLRAFADVIEPTPKSHRTVIALASDRHRITLVATSPGAGRTSLPLFTGGFSAAPSLAHTGNGEFHGGFRPHSSDHAYQRGLDRKSTRLNSSP